MPKTVRNSLREAAPPRIYRENSISLTSVTGTMMLLNWITDMTAVIDQHDNELETVRFQPVWQET